MNQLFHLRLKSIAAIIIVGMLFSCINDSKKVRDFLAEKNLPIAVAKDAHHIYKDSGRITSTTYALVGDTAYLNSCYNNSTKQYNKVEELKNNCLLFFRADNTD